jgi:hypothetical protein
LRPWARAAEIRIILARPGGTGGRGLYGVFSGGGIPDGVFGLLVGAGLAMFLLLRFRCCVSWAKAPRNPQHGLCRRRGGATMAISLYFYDDNFVLFLVATVLVYILTCLGLNIQFGFVGVVNFAGASFLAWAAIPRPS